jgi:hypothetical protein
VTTEPSDDLDALAAWLNATPPPDDPVWLSAGLEITHPYLFWGWAKQSLALPVKGQERAALAWKLAKAKATLEGRTGL